LVAANSLGALSGNLTRLVAPSLGGALLGLLGLPSVVLADSASYLVSGLLVALIHPPRDAPASASRAAHPHPDAPAAWARAWREWRDGLRVIWRDRVLATLFLVRAASAVAQGIFIVLIVPFVKDALLGGAVVLGWLVTAQGVGGLVGSLVGGRVGRAVAPAGSSGARSWSWARSRWSRSTSRSCPSPSRASSWGGRPSCWGGPTSRRRCKAGWTTATGAAFWGLSARREPY